MAIHAPQKIESVQSGKSIAGLWIFTVLWCAISFTVFGAFAFGARDVMGGAVGGLFSLIGLVMIYASIQGTLEYSKYGKVHLTLLLRPLETGGKVEARLELPRNMQAGHVSAELACVQVVWSRGEKGFSKREHDEWTGKKVFAIRRGPMASEAMLVMDVPADQPGSSLPNEGPGTSMFEAGNPGAGVETDHSYYRWELRIKAEVPGVDLARTFRVKVAGGARTAPGLSRERPPLDAALERRLDARRSADRKLQAACAIIGFAPFVVPFAIMGLGVGLAGCPMGWSNSNPPHCMLAGINWGRLMAGAADLMFILVPAGIVGSTVLYFVGRVWLDRHQPRSSGNLAGLAIGVVVVGFFIYQAWQFSRPFRNPSPAPSAAPSAKPVAAGIDASNVGRGYQAYYVNVTGKDFTAEVHGADLRVRIGEVRLETTGKRPDTPYYSLGINVYQRGRNLGTAYSDVRGNLTAAAPSVVLSDRVFSLPGAGAACAQGGCEARLILGVQTSPNVSHGENTDFAALDPVVAATR